LRPVPDNLSQKWPRTYPTYDVTYEKTTLKPKIVFHCKLEDSPSLKGLSSSWAQLTGKLWSCRLGPCGQITPF